jgi:hypothetical protein
MRHFRDETTEKEIYRDPPSAFSEARSAFPHRDRRAQAQGKPFNKHDGKTL